MQTPELEFPCSYTLKIIGYADTIEAAVLPIIHKHVPDLGEGAIELRPSHEKKYLALSVTIQATSKAQLDALYQDLTACKAVLMAL